MKSESHRIWVGVALAVSLLLVATSPADATTFATHTITTAADGGNSVYAVDLDGDSDMDVLSASSNDDKIAWYENDGSENFTPHTITTAADGARSVFAVDVDGDLDIDVLSASFNDNTVSWYENDGSENFTPHSITTSALGARSVFALDVDGDSDVDVLSASFNDSTIAWYENDGSENFTPHTIIATAIGAYAVYAVDVDGDLDMDVLSASFSDNTIAWYENDGSENFTPHTISTAAMGAASVYAADVDGDSDVDVLSASVGDNKVAWYENDGSENFTPHTITTTPDGSISVYAVDVDSDLDMDVLSASTYDHMIAWYENDGSENFTDHTITTVASGAQSVYAADVDGDANVDVLSASSSDDEVMWYENIDATLNSLVLHPTGDGATLQFGSNGCSEFWDCLNDQTANAGTGPPEAYDPVNYLLGTSGQRVMLTLDSGTVPAGATISEISIHAQVYRGNGGGANLSLSYQRSGGATTPDASPINGLGFDLTTGCCTEISATWSGLSWTTTDLDNLQVGAVHNSGNSDSYITQMYVGVKYYVLAAPLDSDGDGLWDLEEDANTDADNDPATNPGPDTDGDLLVNYLDSDDDDDGTLTSAENADPNGDGDPRDALDSDHDGQPDYLDLPTVASDGTVGSEQKISDTTGGFSATLNDDDGFGTSVAGIGDIDGDGLNDIAVGVQRDDDGGNNRGAVHVLFLNADGTVKAERKISDTAGGLTASLDDGDILGIAVAGIGDLDGDGINDIAAGALNDDDGGTNRGAVYVLFLNADGTVKAEQKISDTVGGLTAILDDGDGFGMDVAGIGDLDGDGTGDIAVGAYFDDDGGADRGAVHVLFLNADGSVKAEQKISDTSGGLTATLDDGDIFGVSVAGIGDLDGDGVNDIAVGAELDDDGGTDRGAVHVLFLNADGTVKAEQKISDTAGGLKAALDDSVYFGVSVAGIGDLNDDGVSDIAVGAMFDNDGGIDRGAVHVLCLNIDGSVKTEQKISDTAGGLIASLDDTDRFGISVAGIGDLDGDSLIDIAVGAHNDDDGGPDRGAVYVLNLARAPTLSVVVSKPAFAFGVSPVNQWLWPDSSLIVNDGTVAENFIGQISTFTDGGNNWAISNTTNGADSVRAQWSATSSTGPWTDVSAYDTDFTVSSNVAVSDTVTIWFRIQTPLSTSSFSEHASTLTVTAEAF